MKYKPFLLIVVIFLLISCSNKDKLELLISELSIISVDLSNLTDFNDIKIYLINKKSKIFNKGGYIFVTDKSGSILLHPNNKLIGRNILDLHKNYVNYYKNALITDDRYIQYMYNKNKMILYCKHVKNQNVILFYYSII